MKVFYFFIAVAILHLCDSETVPCDLQETRYGSVCVCRATHCDYLDNPEPIGENDYTIVTSTKEGLRFATSKGEFGAEEKNIINDYNADVKEKSMRELIQMDENKKYFETVALTIEDMGRNFLELAYSASNGSNINNYNTAVFAAARNVRLNIDRSIEYQKIVGFGGAFTGAVSHCLQQIEQPVQDHVYRSFFGKDGISFNMIRISLGGSDFDLAPWAYNELPRDDAELSNFTVLDARDEIKVQQLERMKQVAQLDVLKIKAAAWSSPKWMKTNDEWTGYSNLKKEYYQTWANYHLRFLELMDARNMPIWAISTGNEPLNGVFAWFFVKFMSLGWTPKNQATWLSENLGPTIRNSKYKDVLILGNDDQRYTFPTWFKMMNSSRSNSLDYLDGLAVHWYWDEIFGPSLIDAAHKEMPNKLLLNTESCVGDKPWHTHGPELGSWERAEKYMRAYLQDFQHAFNGWIDWNIVLDEQGGPNYVNNFVDAPVIVNVTNHEEIYKQPMFYAIGHYSKFIPEGSVRIYAQQTNVNIDTVAFRRPDNRIVVVIFNSGRAPVDVTLSDSIRGNIVINIPARSMHTIVYN